MEKEKYKKLKLWIIKFIKLKNNKKLNVKGMLNLFKSILSNLNH
jgi:hypothetical protein